MNRDWEDVTGAVVVGLLLVALALRLAGVDTVDCNCLPATADPGRALAGN